MRKKICLTGVALFLGIFFGWQSPDASETVAPMAPTNTMMLEHMGMDCTICHGIDGPKGVNMGNHPKQQCTDCHVQGLAKTLQHKEKRTGLARELMLKHGAALNCKVCHGEKGPDGMMLEHIGMDCQTCHVVEERK